MLADYMDSLTTYGAAFYRNLFWEAGMVGQVLYLEAEEAGIPVDRDRLLLRRSHARGLRYLLARVAEPLSLHGGWLRRGQTAHHDTSVQVGGRTMSTLTSVSANRIAQLAGQIRKERPWH